MIPLAYLNSSFITTDPTPFRRVTVLMPRSNNAQNIPTPPSDPTTNPSTNGNGHDFFATPTIQPQSYALPVTQENGLTCLACRTYHVSGRCPVKLAGLEYCNLCGMAHYGQARICPHIQSETQVRTMLEALRYSTEPEHLVETAKRYLRGLKGHLVQLKKQKEAKEHAAREAEAAVAFQAARAPVWKVPTASWMGPGAGAGGGGAQ
ncbi:hypothetical protein LTR62_008074 [Meristemomyces frigidus]|uniref:Mit1 C-terminal Zn finger 2 domain-containing protein n=1 Tax=Meristemomyces frigidus TaxID=1508187 RepID=A0AAN7TAD3_9PEZI|nr:hypothetical protein LTR62_008074 [Meristemomyces frigidus]